MNEVITPQYLRECLRYDEKRGKLFWRVRPRRHFESDRGWNSSNARFAGAEALTANCHGYRRGRIAGQYFFAHRVIWAIVHGAWPEHEVDHIDGDRSNNALANLRHVTRSAQMRNLKLRRNNKSGRVGVIADRDRGQWKVHSNLNGKNLFVGRFDSFDAACAARSQFERQNKFHPNHGQARR